MKDKNNNYYVLSCLIVIFFFYCHEDCRDITFFFFFFLPSFPPPMRAKDHPSSRNKQLRVVPNDESIPPHVVGSLLRQSMENQFAPVHKKK